MRVTHHNWGQYFKECPKVLLNGRNIEHVVAADDTLNEVVVIVYDEAGRPVIADDSFVHETLCGRVEIVGELQPWAVK